MFIWKEVNTSKESLIYKNIRQLRTIATIENIIRQGVGLQYYSNAWKFEFSWITTTCVQVLFMCC